MKEIEGYVIPKEVELSKEKVPEITHFYLEEPTIFFNEADVKEKRKPYIKIIVKLGE